MYLSLNWVKKWLKLPKDVSNSQIALDLTMSTVEVEEVVDQATALENIVVGKIEEITKHPQADRLQVCQVNLGEYKEQIVCGGSNVSKGMLVAVAKLGSKIKWHGAGEYITLEKANIRGVESRGMIAAASEIGLDNLFPKQSEKEILDLSSFKLKIGQPLSQALGLDDIIIDIDNKSINHRPDLWGQYGLARELAAIYKINLKKYTLGELKTSNETKLKVSVEDTTNCFRYTALAIKNIKVQDSPWWLKQKLNAVGLRSINNIVDVTNYVMYDLGQPLHAFDAQQIEDHHLIVKQANLGDFLVTLDGVKRKLPKDALMIADAKKNLALAGVMGGQSSEISSNTTEIILESANFKAASVRRSSMALSLRTESSARFEKSLDPVLTELALKKATELILALCPDSFVSSSVVDINHNPFKEIVLNVPEALINKRFGVEIPTSDIKDILKRLKFDIKYKAKTFTIKVPSFRATKDISIPEDIVEEVARIYGYNNIEISLPSIRVAEPSLDISHRTKKEMKQWLVLAQQYTEVYNYAFTDIALAKKIGLTVDSHIKVKNAFSPELAYLNLSLLPNLLKKVEENLRWFDEFKIFELERVFDKSGKSAYHTDSSKNKFLPKQCQHLVGLEVSQANSRELFLTIKGLVESLMDNWQVDYTIEQVNLDYASLAFSIKSQDIVLGYFGLLADNLLDTQVKVGFWQLDFSLLIKYIGKAKQYESLPKFPSVKRDMAIILDQSINWIDIEAEIRKASPLIQHLEPFDVFMDQEIGEHKKSLAFHLEFRSKDKTLESEDIDKLMNDILQNLGKKFKAVLR